MVRAVLAAVVAWAAFMVPAVARMAVPAATAVSVRLTSHPSAATRSNSARFTWKATGTNAVVNCRIGSGRYVRCSRGHTYTHLPAGLHVFTVRVKSGRTTRSASYRWTVDATPPSDPMIAGGSTTWTTGPVTITASGSKDGGSGLSGYQHRSSLDAGAWSAAAAGGSVSISATGVTWVQFRAVDKAGNASAWMPAAGTAAATATIDHVAPTVPAVSGGVAGWSNAASETLTASGSTDSGGSGLSGYEYRTSSNGGASWSQASAGPSAVISGEGVTQVEFCSTDLAGNGSAWTTPQIVQLDRTAPAVTVSGGAAAWTNAASVMVTASATDAGSGVASYQYRTSTTNGASWSAATPGSSVPISATGQTLVEFQATDATGNASAWPATAPSGGAVWIDRTAPTTPTSVTGGSLSWQKVPSITFTASGSTDAGGSGLAGYQYRTSTDGGTTWSQPQSGPATISSDGTTLVQMRAIDNAGNVSASWAPSVNGAQNTAKIDNTPPSLPAVSGGSAVWQNVPSVQITASGSADSEAGMNHYEYRTSTDGGQTWTNGPSPSASVTVTAEGSTWVEFRSVDNLGNASAWTPVSAASQADIDRTAPATPVVSGAPPGWSSAASVTLTATATDATSGVASYTYRTSPDGLTWTSGTGPSVTVSAEGDTQVQFQATDQAGNTSPWSPVANVQLDRLAPSVPTPSGGSSAWTDQPVDISATGSTDAGSGLAGYQYRTSTNNGSSWSAAASGGDYQVTAQGTTLVEFRAVDNVGRLSGWSAISAAATAKIDSTVPTAPTSVTGGNYQAQRLASETVTASGSTDAGGSGLAGYQYRTSGDLGVTWSQPLPGSSVTISAEGITQVQFQAIDGAGNVSAWAPASQTMTSVVDLDRTPPSLPTVAYTTGAAGCSAGPKTLTASGSYDGIFGAGFNHYEYTVNGGTVKTGPSVTISASGSTTVQFRAVDSVGNQSAWVPTTVCIS
jgi:hypothetical protein